MTAIDKRPEPGRNFCHVAPIRSFIFSLVIIAFSSGSAVADDATIGTLPKSFEVAQSKGIVTELAVQDGLKRTERPPIAGPLRASKNPNYFQDAHGDPLILCGSHTWNTLQDWGANGSLQALDFDAFVQFLKAHGHNFTLLWYSELPRVHGLPSTEKSPPDFTVGPHPWTRTGPGQTTDGGLKFDLTKFDPVYFDRLRTRVKALHGAGIYVGVYLFTGEFQLRFRSRSDGYPFTGPNNVNQVDDGYRGGAAESGLASVTMTAPNAITDLQDAYVRKVIDTLNDLPNVLWIVSEEAPTKSTWWNSHLISVVRAMKRKNVTNIPSATRRSARNRWIQSSTTRMRTGSRHGPRFLLPNHVGSASPGARSTSMTATTVTSGCGMNRRSATGTTPGKTL